MLSLPVAGVLFWISLLLTARQRDIDDFNRSFDLGDRAAVIIGSLGNAGLAFVGLGMAAGSA